jgi:hypothetical protein
VQAKRSSETSNSRCQMFKWDVESLIVLLNVHLKPKIVGPIVHRMLDSTPQPYSL